MFAFFSTIRGRLALLILFFLVVLAGHEILAILELKASLMNDREVRTRQLVEVAHSVLVHFHDLETKGRMKREEAQTAAKEVVKALRYRENDYFWINDMIPTMVMHPFKPELDGKNLGDFKDPEGTPLFIRFVETVRQSREGFVPYLWPKPGSKEPVAKISFVRGFEPWGWIIGSGIYVDDVREIYLSEAWKSLFVFLLNVLLLGGIAWAIARTIARPLHTVTGLLGELAAGDLTQRLSIHAGIHEIRDIGGKVDHLAAGLARTVRAIGLQSATVSVCVEGLTQVRQTLTGDYRRTHDIANQVHANSRQMDEAVGGIDRAIQETGHRLRAISDSSSRLSGSINTIASAAEQASANVSTMAAAAEEMTGNVREVSQRLTEVNDSVSAVSAAVEEMTISLEEVRRRCQTANRESEEADRDAKGTLSIMSRLAVSAREINKVVEVIRKIADQTNMLALNAAIEAAGAGEAGKGFAVVANEVKELARQTTEATTLIGGNARDIQENTKAVSEAVDRIIHGIGAMSEANREIVSAVDEQASSVTEIARSMASVAGAADGVTRNALELENAVGEVARAAGEAATGTGDIARATAEVVREAHQSARQAADSLTNADLILKATGQGAELSRQVQGRMTELFQVVNYLEGSVNTFGLLSTVVEETARALDASQTGLNAGAFLFPVGPVKSFHLQLMVDLEKIAAGAAQTSLSEEALDEERCPLGRWLASLSNERRATVSRELVLRHGQIHQRARQAAALFAAGQRDRGREELEGLETQLAPFFREVDRVQQEGLG